MLASNAKQVGITDFLGGLNVMKPSIEVDDSQTPDAQNIINNEYYGFSTRYGYTKYFATALGTAAVNGIFTYNTFNSSTFVIAYGTGLYLDLGASATCIYSGLVNTGIRSFELEGNIYFLDGSSYIGYDGTTATAVSGYIPTYYIDKSPDGSNGTLLDELNYIQSGFKETFCGNGTATTFYMSYGSLTTASMTVLVDNATMTLSAATSGFEVNYASGYVTLTTAASTGVGNVEITAWKEVLAASSINKCTVCETYGEGNDTFAFLAGNTSFPSRIFWTDVQDPSYFPATSYADVGVKNDKMVQFLHYAGSLLLLKNRSIHVLNSTPPNQSITELYTGEGCIAPDSARVVDGYPVFLSQRGVVFIDSINDASYYEGYRLPVLSEDVNGISGVSTGIQTQTTADKTASFAVDFDNKYFLFIGSYVYIYQYLFKRKSNTKMIYPWLKWSLYNQPTAVCEKDGSLYFGKSGNIYVFDETSISDDGNAIDAYYYTKKFSVERSHDWIKWFLKCYINFLVKYGQGIVAVSVFVDDEEIVIDSTFNLAEFWNPDDFNPWDFNPNSTETIVEVAAPLHKKGKYIQVKLRCSTLNSSFTLYDIRIDYTRDRKVR